MNDDKLIQAAAAAREAGMSYGQWMAMQYAPKPTQKPAPGAVRKPVQEYNAVCAFCGKPFYRNKRHRMYCTPECYDKQNIKRTLERYHKKRGGGSE